MLLGSMTSLTVGASIAKGLFPVFGPAGTTFLRLCLSALILMLVVKPWRVRFSASQWRLVVAYGVGLGLMNFWFYEAIARIPIGIAIAIEFLGPLSVAFFYSRSRVDFVWATLALIGIVLLLPRGPSTETSLDWVGVGYALAAAAMWAFYIVVGQKAGANAPASLVTAFGVFFAFLTVTPFGAVAAKSIFEMPAFLPSAIAVGLLSSAIPYSLEMAALKRMDSKTFGIFLSLEPAVGTLAAFLFLRETLSIPQLIAIACVITASIGSTITANRKKPTGLAS